MAYNFGGALGSAFAAGSSDLARAILGRQQTAVDAARFRDLVVGRNQDETRADRLANAQISEMQARTGLIKQQSKGAGKPKQDNAAMVALRSFIQMQPTPELDASTKGKATRDWAKAAPGVFRGAGIALPIEMEEYFKSLGKEPEKEPKKIEPKSWLQRFLSGGDDNTDTQEKDPQNLGI